jgi:hypothetical protein
MTLQSCLNPRQITLAYLFQLNSYSRPLHVLRIERNIYVHFRIIEPPPPNQVFSGSEIERVPPLSALGVQDVTPHEANHHFSCCTPLRSAIERRVSSSSYDTILCSTYLKQSDSVASCYIATGDGRELDEMAENGNEDWILVILRRPQTDHVLGPRKMSILPNKLSWWDVALDVTSESSVLCRTFLTASKEARNDPFFEESDWKFLTEPATWIVHLPLDPIRPLVLNFERRFVELVWKIDGVQNMDMLAVYLTRFAYGPLTSYDMYHESIRHCRRYLTSTLALHAAAWLKEVKPEYRRTYLVVSRLGTEVTLRNNSCPYEGRLVGVLGEPLMLYGLITTGAEHGGASVVPLENIEM